MGLYKTAPPLSGRMGALWTLSGIRDSAVIEFGCMGHMAYGRTFLHRMGSHGGKLYSTHIGETDIAMGDTSRLSGAIEQVSEKEQVKTIFLLPSSVPEITGIDLNAIAYELSPQFPDVQIIPISAGGFDLNGYKGVELTLLQLAKTFPKEGKKTKAPSFNLIGSCGDMFRFQADGAELSRLLWGAFSIELLCEMTSDTSISGLERMGSAHINIVMRREGEPAAKYLQKRFGTPYLLARPYGIEETLHWLEQVGAVSRLKANMDFIQREKEGALEQIYPMRTALVRFLRAHKDESRLTLAGHGDVIPGIARYGKEFFCFEKTVCYCDCPDMTNQDMVYLDDRVKAELVEDPHGFLMGSGELLHMARRDKEMQIAFPDDMWHHAYEPPLAGVRGAVHLASMWANEMMRRR